MSTTNANTQQSIKPLIYFKVGNEKVYLLVKSSNNQEWKLPEFTITENQYSQDEIEAINTVYKLLEEQFAISRNEIDSMTLQEFNKTAQTAIVNIEIKEEAVIVLSDDYFDYTWNNKY